VKIFLVCFWNSGRHFRRLDESSRPPTCWNCRREERKTCKGRSRGWRVIHTRNFFFLVSNFFFFFHFQCHHGSAWNCWRGLEALNAFCVCVCVCFFSFENEENSFSFLVTISSFEIEKKKKIHCSRPPTLVSFLSTNQLSSSSFQEKITNKQTNNKNNK
jgi:hypothetical protein